MEWRTVTDTSYTGHQAARLAADQPLPEGRARWPLGPKTTAWLARYIPAATQGAKAVAASDAMAERARAMAMEDAP